MAQLTWIQGSLLLILQLTVTADETSVLTRAGDEVTLSCSTVIKGQQQCNGTTWTFSGSGKRAAVELVILGQINQKVNTKADRLKLAAKCSLVIKKVREEDVGRYYCQQWKREDNRPDTLVNVSTVALSVLHKTSEGKVQLTAKPGNKNSEKTRPETDNVPRNFQAPIIAVAVVSVIILIVVLVIVRWRAKGKKPPADENAVDLEDNVSYATISHGKNTKRNAEAGGDHDAVTYSTVRACSSSAAASDDPNSVYSVITSTTN
ncbi:uncharacterized protein LOC118558331 isoform X1 [Fundulus heteroclitus]|uniref:uncharacterized protein LOC118558331 isoform X1 n=1 Tax=Fundulus heteroclitus TaxID=8078 RepID=UPI00165ACABE|nr:uncharacterized protein LOC118558331 isoform X1 [Fundulus heteroclitus]